MRHHLSIGALLLFLGLISTPSFGAPPDHHPRPISLPWTALTDSHGVDAVTQHAAGLAYLDGWSLGLWGALELRGESPSNGGGFLGAGRLGPLALGMGFSGLRDGLSEKDSLFRFDLSMALRLSDGLALGAHYAYLDAKKESPLDALSKWDLSLLYRPSRVLALGLALDGLGLPKSALLPSPFLRASLGFHPGTERLSFGFELGRSLREGLGDGLWNFGAELRAMLTPGFWLGGWTRLSLRELDGKNELMGGLSLGLSQGPLGFSLGSDFSREDGVLSALLTLSSEEEASLYSPHNQVIRLQVSGNFKERPGQSMFGKPQPGFANFMMTLSDILHDERVSGLILQIDQAPNWAQAWEIRQMLEKLKGANKKVIVLLTIADMRTYYLASVADEIQLYAAGGLYLIGLSMTQTYLFNLMEKWGVRAEFVRYEEYKSAPETYTQAGPSEPAKEQRHALLKAYEEEWLRAVSSGRKMAESGLHAILNDGPQSMKKALQLGLVDGLIEANGIQELVERIFGRDAQLKKGYQPRKQSFKPYRKPKEIAVLPVVGSIVDGFSSAGLPFPLPFIGDESTGDGSFTEALGRLLRAPEVSGIVIRVDSPGGSAIASDKMWKLIGDAQKHKPLVVSFGNVAASGGYYLAAQSHITGTPLSITGSIGIFAGKVDVSGLFEKLGLTAYTEKTHERADMMQAYRPFSENEKRAAKNAIRDHYERFLEVLAEGRQMDLEEARSLAKGRVWTGKEALKRGLIDQEAGLFDSILLVAEKAGLKEGEFSLRYEGFLPAFSTVQKILGQAFFEAPIEGSDGLFQKPFLLFSRVFGLIGKGLPLSILDSKIEVE